MWSSAVEWCARDDGSERLPRFRFWFALIWLSYDFIDVYSRGTADILWTTNAGDGPLRALQVALIVGQACILAGVGVPLACLVCFFLRLAEAKFFFGLNDFYYYCVMMLPLIFAGEKRAWTRAVLLVQIGWIYCATATLKLNPAWLSGGHLFVRQSYLAAIQGWPYPGWYQRLMINPPSCAWLAAAGVAGEFALAFLVFSRKWPRAAMGLAVALHGFAALALNVWFFGASMVLSIALLL